MTQLRLGNNIERKCRIEIFRNILQIPDEGTEKICFKLQKSFNYYYFHIYVTYIYIHYCINKNVFPNTRIINNS
mgnify:CR=1 FL=1